MYKCRLWWWAVTNLIAFNTGRYFHQILFYLCYFKIIQDKSIWKSYLLFMGGHKNAVCSLFWPFCAAINKWAKGILSFAQPTRQMSSCWSEAFLHNKAFCAPGNWNVHCCQIKQQCQFYDHSKRQRKINACQIEKSEISRLGWGGGFFFPSFWEGSISNSE